MLDDYDNNLPPLSTSNHPQTTSQRTFAETTANESFPKKDQAIIFNTIQDIPQIEYIKAFSLLTAPKNIKFASRVSNNRFCIYFSNKIIVDQIIEKQPFITINKTEIPYRRLINPAKRIIISNVQPIIPHDTIANAINALSITMLSPITFMKAGFPNDDFSHIGSFRRQVFIHPEHSDKIPSSILLHFDQTEYRVFLSDDTVTCFSCKQTGHTSNHCKNGVVNTAVSILFNNTNIATDKNIETTHSLYDISTEDKPKENTPSSTTSQKPAAQVKRPAPSTTSSSCQENTPTEKPPNNLIPPQVETTITQATKGTLASKLKDSSKTPTPLQKKPKRSNSIEQIIIKLEEALLPAKVAFEKIPNLKIDFNQLKYIIENSLTEKNISSILSPFNISSMEMIEIIDTVRPKVKSLCIKNRLTRLADTLLDMSPFTSSTDSTLI
ncbi:unnamed protein product [Macrosiphum euphorbiae]|uniref:CCHC-type domain-containing protein n=1 Tax=Macrosiphum euphorbiae TaxID=13131 RepID=A0AAV0X877_9HEMI|nr:unnamed protein product [Macrosiphum euphorbiae]